MKAAAAKQSVELRNPQALRPWQHVLEPLSGYLLLGQQLLAGKKEFAEAWNFGPASQDTLSVAEVAQSLSACWPDVATIVQPQMDAPHEAELLRLDCSKANSRLKWHPVWNTEKTIQRTADWYRRFYREKQLGTADDLAAYCHDAKKQDLIWSK